MLYPFIRQNVFSAQKIPSDFAKLFFHIRHLADESLGNLDNNDAVGSHKSFFFIIKSEDEEKKTFRINSSVGRWLPLHARWRAESGAK